MTRQALLGLTLEVSIGTCVIPRSTMKSWPPCLPHFPPLYSPQVHISYGRPGGDHLEDYRLWKQGVDLSDLDTTAVIMFASTLITVVLSKHGCRVNTGPASTILRSMTRQALLGLTLRGIHRYMRDFEVYDEIVTTPSSTLKFICPALFCLCLGQYAY